MFFSSDVVQQTCGYQDVIVYIHFCFGDFQCMTEHPVNMLFVMGSIFHAVKHKAFQ